MVERMTVNHEVPSSSLGWGAILLCRTGWFRISEISVVTRIKWFLECTKAATVEIRYNRKHIGFIPNLTFKGDCWRIWLGRCLGTGTVLTQKCGDNPCIVDASSARISVGYIAILTS